MLSAIRLPRQTPYEITVIDGLNVERTLRLTANGQLELPCLLPDQPQHAASKEYVDQAVDGITLGLDLKEACAVATVQHDVSLSGLQLMDGYQIQENDRVLVKDQDFPETNGVYLARTGAWVRADDCDTIVELVMAHVWINHGSTNGDTSWVCTVQDTAILGSSPIVWSKFSGQANVAAGTGLVKDGNTLSLAPVTANRALVSNGSGILSPSLVTSTELGCLSGITGSIQGQLDARMLAYGNITPRVAVVTGNYNVGTYDCVLLVTADCTVFLPPNSSAARSVLWIKRVGGTSAQVIIQASAPGLIEGSANLTALGGNTVCIVNDGTNWQML